MGNVFESFVVEELIRGVQAVAARNLNHYHFRTKAGGEIDLILEGSFGLLPVEIKYQSNTTKKQLTSMINFIELHQLPYGLVVNNCGVPRHDYRKYYADTDCLPLNDYLTQT